MTIHFFASPGSDPPLVAARELLASTPATLAGALSSPLAACLALLAGFILVSWALAVLTGNYSWVDRLWSITPPVYVIIFAAWDGGHDTRLLFMAVLSLLWGARLTFNFARKGGYHPKEEDYRWAFVRQWLKEHDPLHPLGRELFSLVFIALYQHVLIALLVIPASVVAWSARGAPLSPIDLAAGALFLILLALETLTDQQQWDFQQRKHALSAEARAKAGGDLARGFLTTGAFRYSRHLNFFCEFMLWWAFYLFTLPAGEALINWTALGPLLLTLLFQGSTLLTELLSIEKYPAYRLYQRTTSRLIPLWPGPAIEDR